MEAVCRKYGALLILDEVMCGMGRTGTMHAWQQEGVGPDIQTIGKCLGGGYQPVAGVLASRHVIDVLRQGSSVFVHGHTYQGHPAACAAALEVQRIIRDEDLLSNVRTKGPHLSKSLFQKLGGHPNVGDIRGRGLFWGIEFVKNKETGEPFPLSDQVAMEISELALGKEYAISVYPGTGTARDGLAGDHIILAPPYNITGDDVELITSTVKRLVEDYFKRKVG
ncbi:hypothetical protein VTK73DRAFT_9130 [Phialemonium thermophilum]|uniref:Aminotransferase n=1 Tax=Phialemonium thermophilum TaxID=223376 RepID=A0ABR3W4U6_9PEZI